MTYARDQFTGNIIALDFFSTFCGDLISKGTAREVYVYAPDPRYVVKIEVAAKSFQNMREWEFWRDFNFVDDIAKWLAPCKSISPSGIILIQRRTKPIPAHRYPDRLPQFLTDIKRENFGLIGNRVVAHDYGRVVTSAPTTARKALWRY